MILWEWERNGNKKVIPAHLYFYSCSTSLFKKNNVEVTFDADNCIAISVFENGPTTESEFAATVAYF